MTKKNSSVIHCRGRQGRGWKSNESKCHWWWWTNITKFLFFNLKDNPWSEAGRRKKEASTDTLHEGRLKCSLHWLHDKALIGYCLLCAPLLLGYNSLCFVKETCQEKQKDTPPSNVEWARKDVIHPTAYWDQTRVKLATHIFQMDCPQWQNFLYHFLLCSLQVTMLPAKRRQGLVSTPRK